jgi:hypothetical protein
MSIHTIRSANPAEISQESIEQLIAMENSLRRTQAFVDNQKLELLNQLLSGAKVEIGVHTAEIVESIEHGALIQKLEIH